eukprot:4691492-Heterocapsa_arctica.AAC.1
MVLIDFRWLLHYSSNQTRRAAACADISQTPGGVQTDAMFLGRSSVWNYNLGRRDHTAGRTTSWDVVITRLDEQKQRSRSKGAEAEEAEKDNAKGKIMLSRGQG